MHTTKYQFTAKLRRWARLPHLGDERGSAILMVLILMPSMVALAFMLSSVTQNMEKSGMTNLVIEDFMLTNISLTNLLTEGHVCAPALVGQNFNPTTAPTTTASYQINVASPAGAGNLLAVGSPDSSGRLTVNSINLTTPIVPPVVAGSVLTDGGAMSFYSAQLVIMMTPILSVYGALSLSNANSTYGQPIPVNPIVNAAGQIVGCYDASAQICAAANQTVTLYQTATQQAQGCV